MLSFQSYTKAIDLWSVGCIFAELLGAKPLFKGRDYVDQLNQILRILGTPDEATMERIGSRKAQMYIRSLPKVPKVPFKRLYSHASRNALDLLEKLLAFDPSERISVEEALAHPYLETYHDSEDEPVVGHFDFGFESAKSMTDIKTLIKTELKSWEMEKSGLMNKSRRKTYNLADVD